MNWEACLGSTAILVSCWDSMPAISISDADTSAPMPEKTLRNKSTVFDAFSSGSV